MVCAGESRGQQGESSTQGARAVVDARYTLKQELHQVPFPPVVIITLAPFLCCGSLAGD